MSARPVTSLTNPTVKAARALHMRKAREASGLFLAEGLKLVAEARRARAHAQDSALTGRGGRPARLPRRRRRNRRPAARSSKSAARSSKRSPGATTRRPCSPCSTKLRRLADLDPAAAPAWIALEAVRDPGNLGTIMRTADAAGVGGVILVGETCDPYSVEAVRATMGSIFAVPLYRASTAAFLAWRGAWPGSVVGTLLSADVDYRAARYAAPCLLLMGPEQAGLSAALAALCDVVVKIPMRGRADSLNLAVAAGVMLYAAIA